jgi:hypothetical protein
MSEGASQNGNDRLNQPNLTDRTGMGGIFAKLYFEDCDKVLSLAYNVLGDSSFAGDLTTLKHLMEIETGWTLNKQE